MSENKRNPKYMVNKRYFVILQAILLIFLITSCGNNSVRHESASLPGYTENNDAEKDNEHTIDLTDNTPTHTPKSDVVWADPAFEAGARQSLMKPDGVPIMKKELHKITSLSLSGVSDLTDLKYFENLEGLSVDAFPLLQKPLDLYPISKLKKLVLFFAREISSLGGADKILDSIKGRNGSVCIQRKNVKRQFCFTSSTTSVRLM